MKKIISLFQRNYDGDRLVRNEVTPGAEWVINGEGSGTRKFDGTCCLIKDGKLFKRYDVKKGKTAPPDFIPAQEPDEVTGYHPGWRPVGDGPEDQWHREAFASGEAYSGLQYAGMDNCNAITDGTYELVGPSIQGNPENYKRHILIRHGDYHLLDEPRDFEGLKFYFQHEDIEGIVWHHPDGRMVKIKKRDFGFKR